MSFSLALSCLINGLAVGLVYAMTAMGLILLLKAVGVLNFAQGALIALGSYVASWAIVDLNLPLYIAYPLMLLIYALIGFVFMLTAYWPLRNAKFPVATTIACLGMGIVVKEAIPLLFGTWPRTLPNLITNADGTNMMVSVLGIDIQAQYLIAIAVAVIFMLGTNLLFNKMYFGRMMQAAAQDKQTASLIGISPFFTISMTYMLVLILISVGGYTISPIFSVSLSLQNLQNRAFAGTVIGGWGSTKGCIIGCLLVGLVEAFSSVWLPLYKDAIIFLVLILFLAVRPQGLVKNTVGSKA